MGRRWFAHMRENDRWHRFKLHKVEDDWPKGGEQENDWMRIIMTVLRSTGWESSSDVENRKAD